MSDINIEYNVTDSKSIILKQQALLLPVNQNYISIHYLILSS
jgi:hypothetical protein